MRRGTAPTPLNDDDGTSRQANPQIRYRWRRQAPEPHCNKEQYLWWRRDDPASSPMQCIIGACSLLWRQYRDRLHLVTTTQHTEHIIWKPLLYSVEKLLKFCNVAALKGGSSGYGCWCSCVAVSPVCVFNMYTVALSWKPRVWCSSAAYVGESSTNSAH